MTLLFSWILISLTVNNPINNDSVSRKILGAWTRSIETEHGSATIVKTYTKNYFIYAVFTEEVFLEAGGGQWEITGNILIENYEFNTSNPSLVGQDQIYNPEIENDVLKISGRLNSEWNRIDKGESELSGAWIIAARKHEGKMEGLKRDTRRTFKILSGTRFQWVSYDISTRTFYGTAGGEFELNEGKYIEKIEFYSEDNSKIGTTLVFDFELEENKWIHSGISSQSQPIYEIWTFKDD